MSFVRGILSISRYGTRISLQVGPIVTYVVLYSARDESVATGVKGCFDLLGVCMSSLVPRS